MPQQAPERFEAGIFLVDKPAGISSFAVVSRLRRILKMKKIGHAGTLDPFATGLLIVCAGRSATRLISRFMEGKKEYLATLRLGEETETLDTEGVVTVRCPVGRISGAVLEACLEKFRGIHWQMPPAYSALKYKGKPLYYYARRGIEVTKAPREVEVAVLERTDGFYDISDNQPEIGIRVVCSKGTYIRVLASDVGRELGCGAHLKQLRRTRSGCFSITKSLTWEELSDVDALEHCLGKMITIEQAWKMLQ